MPRQPMPGECRAPIRHGRPDRPVLRTPGDPGWTLQRRRSANPSEPQGFGNVTVMLPVLLPPPPPPPPFPPAKTATSAAAPPAPSTASTTGKPFFFCGAAPRPGPVVTGGTTLGGTRTRTDGSRNSSTVVTPGSTSRVTCALSKPAAAALIW